MKSNANGRFLNVFGNRVRPSVGFRHFKNKVFS